MLKNEINENNLPQTAYLQVNSDLINNDKYKNLDMTTIMLYAVYSNRTMCSIYNSKDGSWKDGRRIYILFSNEEAAKILRVSPRKISDSRNKLIEHKLIEIKKVGLKQNRIFVANPEHTEADNLVMPYKNSKINYTITLKPDVAKNASSTSQKSNTSTPYKELPSTSGTSVTTKTVSEDYLIDALAVRYKDTLTNRVMLRLKQAANHSYTKTKAMIDIIFKASSSARNKFIKSGIPVEYSEFMTFDGNKYFKDRLEGAILVVSELAYRYKKISNPAAFMFSFLRGFFIEQTKQFISDHCEIDNVLAAVLNSVNNKKAKGLPLA
ncbi:MAG: replication initiator protein A [Liquorilactobacillus hordei]|uniref:replication initiator protein A n=1 Tax=Liquorilactobacillus hordei TaxID=468911 RepID=UPI0039E7791D